MSSVFVQLARPRAAALGLIFAAGVLSGQAAAQTTIRVGGTYPGEEPVWYLAKKPELFKNAGKAYKMEWSVFQGTAPITQALIANAVDCGTQAPIGFAKGVVDGGLQAYVLGSMVDEKPGYFSVFWATLTDSPIRKVEDLKGRSIASTAIGGGTYYHMRMIFSAHGLDPDNDVKVVEMPFPLMDQSLRGGRVDVAMYAQPFAGSALKKGGVRPVFYASEAFNPLVNVFEACRKDFVDKNTDAVRAYMADYADAVKYALAHPEETKKLVSEVTKIPVETLDTFLLTKDDFYRPENGRPNFDGIQAMWDGYYKHKIIPRPLKITDYQRLDVTPGGQ